MYIHAAVRLITKHYHFKEDATTASNEKQIQPFKIYNMYMGPAVTHVQWLELCQHAFKAILPPEVPRHTRLPCKARRTSL